MKHYEFEINLYIDGELPKEDEIELFSHLTGCEECRNDFHKYHLAREKAKNYFTKKLEPIEPEKGKSFNIYKIGFFTASAAAVLLAFFTATQKPETVYLTKTDVKIDTLIVTKLQTETKFVKKVMTYPEVNQKNYIEYVMNLPAYKLTDKDINNNKSIPEEL